MILIVSTAQTESVTLILAKNEKDFLAKSVATEKKQAEKLLRAIDSFLRGAKVGLAELSGLGVVSGPGGFTALRIGVTTVNALAYALKIPVVSVAAGEFQNQAELVKKILAGLRVGKNRSFNLAHNIVLPFYDREPNIT